MGRNSQVRRRMRNRLAKAELAREKQERARKNSEGTNKDELPQVAFHFFRKLPIELRLKIWRLSVTPCVVAQFKARGLEPPRVTIMSRPTPAVLHTCKESRNELMYREDRSGEDKRDKNDYPHYQPMFSDSKGKTVFFSPGIDALHLMFLKDLDLLPVGDIRSMIFGYHILPPNMDLSVIVGQISIKVPGYKRNFRRVVDLDDSFFDKLVEFQKLETIIWLLDFDEAASMHIAICKQGIVQRPFGEYVMDAFTSEKWNFFLRACEVIEDFSDASIGKRDVSLSSTV